MSMGVEMEVRYRRCFVAGTEAETLSWQQSEECARRNLRWVGRFEILRTRWAPNSWRAALAASNWHRRGAM